jgi:hypothetical protein
VIKFIAETDLVTAIIVQATTNFIGCYVAMFAAEKYIKWKELKTLKEQNDTFNQ